MPRTRCIHARLERRGAKQPERVVRNGGEHPPDFINNKVE
ncbi:MAG: hypothetical protein QOF14_5648 [Hyphomicrobiales bacterium]|nr:hypothetical protein [Hyphomicrobiales bacterium]